MHRELFDVTLSLRKLLLTDRLTLPLRASFFILWWSEAFKIPLHDREWRTQDCFCSHFLALSELRLECEFDNYIIRSIFQQCITDIKYLLDFPTKAKRRTGRTEKTETDPKPKLVTKKEAKIRTRTQTLTSAARGVLYVVSREDILQTHKHISSTNMTSVGCSGF